ncbi:MAG: NrfD/PsrC family molybdoenzyme membrane anchor subunit [Rhodothermales bacterium]
MLEQTITRHNHLIDPTVTVWGWEIPVYLFLGGLVAGMMVVSGYFLFSGRYRNKLSASLYLPGISLVLLTLGMLALFLDLEHKAYVWRLYTTFQISSPMSWGAWILLFVYPALAANALIRPPKFFREHLDWANELSNRLYERKQAVKWVGALNMLLGAMLGVYTGILLSTMASRPLWNSALLGPIFLASGMSGAAALIHMIARDRRERELLAKADNGFIVAELILIGLFLIGLVTSTEAHIRAAGLLLGGPYTAVFWVLVVGIGLVFPLIVQLLAVNHKIQHTPVAPILVIAGGILLRFVIVYAGQVSGWNSF